MFGDHGLDGLPEEGDHEKSPKCLDGNLGDFGEFCKGLKICVKKEKPCYIRFLWVLMIYFLQNSSI